MERKNVFKSILTIRGWIWPFYAVVLYFYLWLFHNALIDDTFIILNYSRTLLSNGTWGFFPGYVANSATSPLNVLLLTIVSSLIGPGIDAVLWLTFLCYIFIAITLTQISYHLFDTEVFGWLGVVGLVFNPLLTSTVGLESNLFIALFVLSIYFFILKRWSLLAISLGLLTIARADGLLFFLIFLMFVPETKSKIRFAVYYGLSIAPWYLYSWVYLGSILPDTFLIKTNYKSWGNWDFFNGLALYFGKFPVETILSFIFLPLAGWILTIRKKDSLLWIIAFTGVIHYSAYSLLGVPPFHWYYVPQVAAVVLVGSLGLGECGRTIQIRTKIIFQFVTLFFFVVPALGMGYLLGKDGFIIKEMPIHSNWGTYEQYKEIGVWLKQESIGPSIELVKSEIGTMAYYCECNILNEFTDRNWVAEYVQSHKRLTGIAGIFYRLNYMFFDYQEFPMGKYSLRCFPVELETDFDTLKEWDVSTKWKPQSVCLLYQ